MRLHDQMSDAVREIDPDFTRLVSGARQEGRAIMRRQRGLRVVGTVLAVTAVAAVGYTARQALPTDAGSGASPQYATGASETEAAGTVPINGRSTVAGLRAAIEEIAPGTFAAYAGQGDATDRSGSQRGTYGELEFTPADGTGPGVVGINVQDGSILEPQPEPEVRPSGRPESLEGGDPGTGRFDCSYSYMEDCAVRTLPNGDRLRTYRDSNDTDNGGVRVVAELWTADHGLRVIAGATNGYEGPGTEWDVTREGPVLTTEQLSEIVTQPWWGFQIPSEYDEAGRQLEPYQDFDELVPVVPSSGPS